MRQPSESKARLNRAQCFDFITVMVVPWSSRDLIPCPNGHGNMHMSRAFARALVIRVFRSTGHIPRLLKEKR